MYTLTVHTEAESDLKNAYNWYEEQRAGLGEDFFLRVDASFDFIIHMPELYPIVYKIVRRKLLEHFPYAIFYVLEGTQISIIAVRHMHQHPDSWKTRHAGK